MFVIPDSVTCKATGVKHKIVTNDQNKLLFVEWCDQIIRRMDNGENVHLSLDTEGWNLGISPQSLGMIQIAECFTPGFIETKGKSVCAKQYKGTFSINLQSGFLVKFPISTDIIDAFSRLFTHNNVTLIIFDFTADLVAIEAAGISVRRESIIDPQCIVKARPNKYFTMCVSTSLKDTCLFAEARCKRFQNVNEALSHKSDIQWDKCNYEYRNLAQPFDSLINQTFLDYSALDIAFGAVSLLGALTKVTPTQLKENTKAKMKGFEKLQNLYGQNGPSLKRNSEFFRKSLNKKLDDDSKYKIWSAAKLSIANYDVFQEITNNKFLSKEKIEDLIHQSEELIRNGGNAN